MIERVRKALFGKPANRQVTLYILVGAFCYVVALGVLVLLVEVFHVEVNLANFIAMIVSIYTAYLLSGKYIFQPGKYSRAKEISAFYLFSFLGLLLDVVLMFLLTEYVPVSYIISKGLVTAVVAVFNFLTRKHLVFDG